MYDVSLITQEEQLKLQNMNRLVYYLHFHDFISIFYVYMEDVSRSVRFVVFYLRFEHTLTISIVFNTPNSIIQTVFLSLGSSLLIMVFTKLLQYLLMKNNALKKIGGVLTFFLACFYIYIILALVSGLTPEESNQFILNYMRFLVVDFLFV